MPLPGVISNQSSIRSGAYSVFRFAAIHTPDVVMQFQPDANASNNVNVTIPYDTLISGDAEDVGEAMTVFITPTSDYVADLRNDAENCAVTYVRREGAIADTLFVGQTPYQYSTSDYVTIVRESRVFQRKWRILENGTTLLDHNIEFRKPKPRILGFYSDVKQIAVGSSSTTYAFSDVDAESMSGGTTSFTWAWDLDGGSFSSGTAASQNPTGSFTAGTYNIRLTVTDSNDIENVMAILLVILPADWNSVIDDTIRIPTLAINNEGFAAGLQLSEETDLSAIIPGSMCMIITWINFADGTSQLTCDMVGWLSDTSEAVVGDEQYLRLKSADMAVLDIAQHMASITLRGHYMDKSSTPTKWFQFERVTPLDGIWFMLSELTTIGNLASVVFPSDYENQAQKTTDLPQSTLTDVLTRLALRNQFDGVQYSPNGEIIIVDSLPYAGSSARDAADTIATLQMQDLPSIRSNKSDLMLKAVQYVLAGGWHYPATRQRPYFGMAPAVLEDGIQYEEIDEIVFDNTLSQAQVLAAIGRGASDHYFAINENLMLDVQLLPGYYTLLPRQDAWLELDIDAGELLSDESFDSNTRFLFISMSQTYNPDLRTIEVSGVLREETGNNDSYSIISQETLPTVLQSTEPPYPPTPAYPYVDSGSSSDGGAEDTYGDDYSGASGGASDPSQPAGYETTPTPGVVGTVSVTMKGGEVAAGFVLESGKTYTLRITGTGKVAPSNEFGDVFDTFDVDATNPSPTSGNNATNISDYYIVEVANDVGITANPDHKADALYSTLDDWAGVVNPSPVAQVQINGNDIAPANGDYNEAHVYYSVAMQGTGSPFTGLKKAANHADNSGSHTYTVYEALPYKGDAFYYKWNIEDAEAYGGNGGLNMDGSPLSGSIAAYNNNHDYEITGIAGADAAPVFEFIDPTSVYEDNSGAINIEIIEEE